MFLFKKFEKLYNNYNNYILINHILKMTSTQITQMFTKLQSSLDGLREKVNSLTPKVDVVGGKRSYDEGYSEGYAKGYAEATRVKAATISPEVGSFGGFNAKAIGKNVATISPEVGAFGGFSAKKIKKEDTRDMDNYVEVIYGKQDIKAKIANCENQIDIYYEGGSSKGWRNGCFVGNLEGNIVKVSYYHPSGYKLVRTFNINKIKMIKNNENQALEAMKAYGDFHNMEEGTVKIGDVIGSSAGVSGWTKTWPPGVADDLVKKFENLEFNVGSPVSKSNDRKRRP